MAISVSQAFKDAMQAPVKVIQATIVTDEQTFTSADYLTNLSIEASGYYFGATTKALEFSLLGTTYNLLNKAINVSISVQTDASNDTWEHCNLGNFYIYEQEVKLEKETTTFKAYDKVGMMAKEYYTGGGFTFPCTVANLAEQFQSKFGLSFTPETLVNGNYQITEDLYAKINNITYRDILAELAGATASIAAIDGVANTLTFRETPRTAIETWTYDNLKSIKLEPKYGAINAVTLSRAPEEDNISVIDEPVIQDEGTELEFEDVSRFKSITLKGETEQTTYTGKNLMDLTPIPENSVTGSQQATYEWVYDAELDRKVLHIQKAGDYPGVFFSLPSWMEAKKNYAISARYKLKVETEDPTNNIYGGVDFNGRNNWEMLGQNGGGAKPTNPKTAFHPTDTWEISTIRISKNASEWNHANAFKHVVVQLSGSRNPEAWVSDIMVEEITDAQYNAESFTPVFEPYVGRMSSPNPDYPQSVQSVTGRQVIKICGKNLLDPTMLESGVISAETGANIENVNRIRTSSDGAISVTGGATYTISTSAELRVALYAYNDSTFITGWGGTWVSTSEMPYTFVAPSNATKIRVAFSFTDNRRMYVSDVTDPQFELGSATEYEQYSQQDFEINLGKNILDVAKLSQTAQNYGVRASSDGVVSSVTPTSDSRTWGYATCNWYVRLPAGTYSISGYYQTQSTNSASVLRIYADNGNILVNHNVSNIDSFVYSFTLVKETDIGIGLKVFDGACRLQLEKGAATSYSQYFEPIELYEINNYAFRDRIHRVGSDWYVRKETGKYMPNGSETWSYSSDSNLYYTSGISASSMNAVTNSKGKSNCLIYDWSQTNAYGFRFGNSWFLQIKNADYSTVADFKTWLSSNTQVFYYTLATPTETKITNPDLIAQLNAVLEAELPSETNFVTSSGDLTAYLDIEAYKKVEVKEIKLANNEILDDDRESTIMPILNSVSGFEFYPFEATTEGHGWHECGDQIAVTDGTNTWDVVINYIKLTIDGGIKETIKGIRPTETQTNYALAGGIMKTIYNTEIKVDKQGQEITSIVSRQDSFEDQTLENFSQVVQNINSVTTTIQTTGGGNLLHNSVGYNINTDKTLVSWTQSGSISSESSPESLSYGAISGSQINLGASSSITQRITVDNSGSQLYTLGFKVKKGATGVVTVHLRNNIDDYTVVIPEGSAILWKNYSIVGVLPHSSYFDVVVETNNAVSSLSITDMMFSVGDTTIPWVSASDEILSKNVAVDSSGVTVRSNATNDYTQLNELGLNGYSDASGSMENVFTVNRDTTEVSKLKARKQISMPPIKIVPVTSGNRAGWGFVKGE